MFRGATQIPKVFFAGRTMPYVFQNLNQSQPKTLFTFTRSFFAQYRKPTTPWFKNAGSERKRHSEGMYEAGVWLLVFGLCYSAVPFYSILCQHFGFDTDLKKKDYSSMQKGDKKLFLHRKFHINFKTEIDPDLNWDFEAVQDQVIVNAGETALVFYKAANKDNKPVIGFSTYEIYPAYATLYFSKIQCFCFHQQLLNPFEELQLPLYFYLEPEICDDEYLAATNDEITIIYKFFKAKHQDLAKMADEELRKVERNKKIIREMRKSKKLKEREELGETGDEIEDDDDIPYGQANTVEASS